MLVDVDDYRGGRIIVGGSKFQGQIQQIYWLTVQRYLTEKAHEAFQRWDEETRSYPDDLRQSSLDGVEVLISQFSAGTIRNATDTDRRLRGAGFPDKVPVYNSGRELAISNSEIKKLAESYRALIAAKVSKPKTTIVNRLEAFGSKYRAIIAIIGVLVAIAFGILRFFFH